MKPERLRLLIRPECGLCEDMARDLRRLRVPFEEIDIEQDEALAAAYGVDPSALLRRPGDRPRPPIATRLEAGAISRRTALSGTLGV